MEPTNAQIEWRKYLTEEISEDQYNAKNVFLSNEELTLKDIPDSITSDEKIFNFFGGKHTNCRFFNEKRGVERGGF